MTKIDRWRGLDRRAFAIRSAQSVGAAMSLALLPGEDLAAAPRLGADPFTLGVASGDPTHDGFVIWTRLAPQPLAAGDGGMPPVPVAVRWEVARDRAFTKVVASGTATALPELAHSVHVEVAGLNAACVYFYRFMCRSEVSRTGRTRTTPQPGATGGSLDFAFITCQKWEDGFYRVYADMADHYLDLVVHLGDYIYEYPISTNARGKVLPATFDAYTETLEQYRLRHALYKTDPDLQRSHARCPLVVIWDDHEVENDYVGRDPSYLQPGELNQRGAAYQAFYEHLPLRNSSRPTATETRIYRQLRWGDLARFHMLDGRQYRTAPVCGYGEQYPCADRFDPAQSLLGGRQERWLEAGLERSRARWNILGNDVLMAELEHRDAGGTTFFWTDSWDGFPAARDRLLDQIVGLDVKNPVVITGDWHSTFVNDIKRDFTRMNDPVIATEFVVPAITSGGDGTPYGPYYGPFIPFNPHIKYFEGDRRGWFKANVTRERMTCDLRFVSAVETTSWTAATERSWVVEDGAAGAQAA